MVAGAAIGGGLMAAPTLGAAVNGAPGALRAMWANPYTRALFFTEGTHTGAEVLSGADLGLSANDFIPTWGPRRLLMSSLDGGGPSKRDIARGFMNKMGVASRDITGHLSVIDFSGPVEVVTLSRGSIIYRWDQTDDITKAMRKMGMMPPEYFTLSPVDASQVGVGAISGRRLAKFRVTEDTEVLKSTMYPTSQTQIWNPHIFKSLEEIE